VFTFVSRSAAAENSCAQSAMRDHALGACALSQPCAVVVFPGFAGAFGGAFEG
jgi:hypothetical protein